MGGMKGSGDGMAVSRWLGTKVYLERWKIVREGLNLVLVTGNVAATVALAIGYRTVPREDILFVLGTISYLVLSDALVFRSKRKNERNEVTPLSISLEVQLTILGHLVVSLILPWVDIWATGAERSVVRLVSPHTFCFSSQVLTEFFFYDARFSTIVRVLVPMLFGAYRVFQAKTWVEQALRYDNWQLSLAAVNLVLDIFTLFYVLLLQVVPVYVKPAIARKMTMAKELVS